VIFISFFQALHGKIYFCCCFNPFAFFVPFVVKFFSVVKIFFCCLKPFERFAFFVVNALYAFDVHIFMSFMFFMVNSF